MKIKDLYEMSVEEVERYKQAYDWQTKLILLIQHNSSKIDITIGESIPDWIEDLIKKQIVGTQTE